MEGGDDVSSLLETAPIQDDFDQSLTLVTYGSLRDLITSLEEENCQVIRSWHGRLQRKQPSLWYWMAYCTSWSLRRAARNRL